MEIAVEPLRVLQDQLNALLAGAVAAAPNLFAGFVLVLLTWGLAVIAGRAAARLLGRTKARPSLQRALTTLVKIGVWLAGLSVAATVVFPNLTPTGLLAGLGLGSIAVGLAFKDIFENFLAGLLILLRKPMRLGDDIECEGIEGRVEQITIRDIYVRKRSGELVLLPNSFIFKNPTTVLTDKPQRRISVVVGVAYGENVDESRDVIREAVEGLDTVDSSREVQVFATGFGSSSIDFMVRWWTGSTPIEEHRSRDQVVAAIKAGLDEAGIEIPFPYRTLTFKDPLRVEDARGEG